MAAVFLDVGANVGTYSVIGCLKSDQFVSYAFEPVSENQRLLEKNIDAYSLRDRVRVEPVAVSDKEGTAKILSRRSGTHSIENSESSETREIRTVTLDGFFAGDRSLRTSSRSMSKATRRQSSREDGSFYLARCPPSSSSTRQ